MSSWWVPPDPASMQAAKTRRHEGRLRVLFVCQNDFTAPTEKQALGFAEELTNRGHEVMVSIGGDLSTGGAEGADRIEGLTIRRHRFRLRGLSHEDLVAARSFNPTLIHAFLSRVPVVAASRCFARATNAPVFVHFGDDEWRLPPGLPGEPLYYRAGRLARRLTSTIHPPSWGHSTRGSLGWVRRRARGLDALTPALAEEVSVRLGRKCAVVLPVMPRIETEDGSLASASLASLPDGPIALFTGSILREYLPDVLLGMRAVADVQARGRSLNFVQAGAIHPRIDSQRLADEAGLRPGTAAFLGYLPFVKVPSLLRAASVLVQPGAPTDFNRLRLPAKLQAYLESGSPTVTFATGFGELLADRTEVLKTYSDRPGELADRILEVLDDGRLRQKLAENGPVAAQRLFDRKRNADALVDYYRAGLEP